MTDTNRESKNSVFTAPTSSNVQPERQPTTVSQDPLLDTPFELAPLPSNGLVYPVDHPWHMKEHVEIKAITAKEENILTNRAYAKKGTTISELLKSCILDKNVDPRSLLVSDRHSLMVAIRSAGYGSIYEDEVTCSDAECDTTSPRKFDLNTFAIKRLDVSDVIAVGANLFQFRLPSSGHLVDFRLLTGHDEEEMYTTAQRQKKAFGQGLEDNVTATLFRSIVGITPVGATAPVTDGQRISRFVQNMRGLDSLALRKKISQITPGIKMSQVLKCPACDLEEEVSMPMGITFLWPNAG